MISHNKLYTVSFEAANLVNESPIGTHPTESDRTSYFSPKDFLLGWNTTRAPSGSFEETNNPRNRFLFVQAIIG